ncbi:predicted protein [Naegleria gruberi]|uniref:Predicted protein n=1 Tax=Naegleria gruberi TaxID=5762 RepID=D2V1Q0_NAEGR|nr:uncharacterized protein NAEGRDRAFT_62653 [Naegleria gruberi]EFC49349.1 predicted protein [Naegleria gruberi]|eukprot:XP_002682093.1 predicted protein [Naegleria gruberi strain NEG-M]
MSAKLICYYCGENEEFGNLKDHMFQCSNNWHAQQQKLIPELQRMYPPRGLPSMMMPSSSKDKASIEKYNTYAKLLYCQESLNPCPSCLKLFKASELGEHFLRCNPSDNSPKHHQQTMQQPQQQQNNKPSVSASSPKKQQQSSTIQPPRSCSPPRQVQYTPPKTSPSNSKSQLVRESSSGSIGSNSSNKSATIASQNIDKYLPVRDSVSKTAVSQSRSSSSQKKAPMRDINGKPIAYCCHLCGREYLNVDSLTFHIPQCLDKRAVSQKELPKEMRTKPPSAPTVPIPEDRLADEFLQQLDEYNQMAYRIFEQSSRVGCKYCGRKFNAEALIVHLRSCEKQADKNPPPFGKNQPGAAARGGVVPFSAVVGKQSSNNSEAYEELERAECSKCGRKFALDRLAIHENSCKGSKKEVQPSPSKILTEKIKNMPNPSLDNVTTKISSQTSSSEPHRVPCRVCGRKFNPDRIEKHESICKK